MPTIGELESRPLSADPDDYPGLKPYAPGTLGARSGDPLPGWSDESIPREARVSSWMRQKVEKGEKLDQFKAEAGQLFGIKDTGILEQEYMIATGLARPELSASEGSGLARFATDVLHALPGSAEYVGITGRNKYLEAQQKRQRGERLTPDEIGHVINHELREKRLDNETGIQKALRGTAGLAKTAAEFLVGSPAAGAAAKAAGLGRYGTFGLETAARVGTVPSLGGYEAVFAQANKAGRTTPNAEDIAQGFTVGLVNSLIAGQIERFGAKLPVSTAAGRIGTAAVAGTLEEDVAAAVLKNMGLETRYGPLVELMQGKRGDNLGRLAYSLIGEGIFAGAGALRGPAAFDAAKAQAVIDAGVKALDAEAAAGKTADEAYQSLWPVTGAWEETILRGQGTSDLFLKAARERMGADASPAAKEYAESLAETLPKEIDPFEGLADQQVKDVAEFAGVDRRGSVKAIKERLLASDAGRALLQAEGRLPRPERPAEPTPAEPAPPAQPEPTPETAPESPGTADPVPEASAPVQVDDRAPAATPEAPVAVGDAAGLAAAVRGAAAGLPGHMGQPFGGGGTGVHKVLVADLYDALRGRLGGAGLGEFKAALLAANRAGALELGRMDMPQAARDPAALARSEVAALGGQATFHVVNVPEGRPAAELRAAEPPAPAPAADRLKRLTMKARDRSAVTGPRPGRTEAGTELRRPREVLSPQQRRSRAEVLLERAGDQARALRALRFRSEAEAEGGRLTAAERKELKRLGKKAREPAEMPASASPAPAPAAGPRQGDVKGGYRVLTVAEPRAGYREVDHATGRPREVPPSEGYVLTEHPELGTREFAWEEWERFRGEAGGGGPAAEDGHRVSEVPEGPGRADPELGWMRGEAGPLPPVGDNHARPLRDFGARLYREASPEEASEFLPNSTDLSGGQAGRLWFANTPELAAGQGANRGVMLEFDPGDVQGQVSLRKPAAEFAYRQGKAELTTDHLTPDKFRGLLRAVTVGKAGRDANARRVRKFLDDLVRDEGWAREELADGRTRYSRPGSGTSLEPGWLTADARLDRALAANPELTPRDRAEIGAAVTRVNGTLPAAVRARLDEAARLGRIDYRFYADHRSLTEDTQRALLADPLLQRDLQSPDKAVRAKAEADRAKMLDQLELIRRGEFTGLGSHFEGVVRIDGPGASSETTGRYGPAGGVLDRAAIAAHEVGHQVGKLLGLDARKDWQAVWAKDIAPRNALTRYASKDPKEGFAEFARLLYGSDVSTAAVRRDFPAATRFFEEAGLFPAERGGRDGPLDNRFVLKVGTGEYHLDAGRGSLLSRLREKVGWLEADRPPATPNETAEANRVVDEERAARGAPPLLTAARMTNPEVWDRAMAKLTGPDGDPDLPARLTNELFAEPRATTVEENALLLHRKVTLQNAHRRAMQGLVAARESGAPPGDVDRFAAAERELLESLDRLDQVLRKTGTEWGRAGQFRRQLAKEDYSLGSMLLKAEVAFGRKLTEAETAEITAQHAEIEQARTRLAEAEAVAPGAFGTPGRAARPAAPPGQKGDLTDLRIAADKAVRRNAATLERGREAKQPPARRLLSTVGRVLDIFRPLKTAFDLSMAGRQAGFFLSTRPKLASNLVRGAKDFFLDERAFDRAMAKLRERPNAPLYEDAGIDFTDVGGPLSRQEEVRAGDLWRKLAGKEVAALSPLARGVVGSERAYVGFLNTLRAEMADAMIATFAADGRPTLAQLKDIGALVNAGTGRATVGRDARQALAHASQVFFAPNYFVSRLQLVGNLRRVATGGSSGTDAVRKLYAREYARALGSLFVLYGIAELLLGDEGGVTLDPRSSDFGKIKMGDTRVDPLGGLAQITTFAGRSVSGQTKDEAGVVTPIRGAGVPAGGRQMSDVLFDFARGKLAPVPGEVINVYLGETFDHKPAGVRSAVVGLGVPMSVESVVEGWSDLGFARGTAAGALNVLGVGVRTHGDRDPAARAVADVHAMRRRWEYDLGRPPEPRAGAPLTKAMVDAVRADDFEAFRAARTDFLNRQILAGRTRLQALESFRESVARIDPLEGRLSDRDRAKFLKSLTDEQRARVAEGRAAARAAQAKVRAWWQRAAAERG